MDNHGQIIVEQTSTHLRQQLNTEKNIGSNEFSISIGAIDNDNPLPDLKIVSGNDLFNVLILFALFSAVLGLAQDLHNISSRKECLPKRRCGDKVHWGLVISLYFSKMIINGFIGLVLGWTALYLFKVPVLGAIAIAGIAGGQGNLLYSLLATRLYKYIAKKDVPCVRESDIL